MFSHVAIFDRKQKPVPRWLFGKKHFFADGKMPDSVLATFIASIHLLHEYIFVGKIYQTTRNFGENKETRHLKKTNFSLETVIIINKQLEKIMSRF